MATDKTPKTVKKVKSKRVKLLKYPKKPKQSASAASIINFFSRCAEIDRENNRRKAAEKQRQQLIQKLRNFRPNKGY